MITWLSDRATVRPHHRATNAKFRVFCECIVFGAKTNGRPRFVKHKQLKSSAKSTQKKKNFFVSVEDRAIPQFLMFYWLCPLVWSTEIESGRRNEKVGSGRELEKGDETALTSRGREQERLGNRDLRRNFTDEQREREQERSAERRPNFTEEQLDSERERVRENRRRTSDERRRREQETARENRRRIRLSLNEDEREGGESEWLSSNFLCIECKMFWLFQKR